MTPNWVIVMTKLVTKKQLRLTYGIPYSLQHIARMEAAKTFPARVKLSQHRVAYVAEEIEAWIEERLKTR
jgi:prophage regulatory protein